MQSLGRDEPPQLMMEKEAANAMSQFDTDGDGTLAPSLAPRAESTKRDTHCMKTSSLVTRVRVRHTCLAGVS